MKILSKILKPILLPHFSQDLFLTIPRIVCGFLLTSNFGASKFGLPWSPIDNNLGFFEVAFWFPKDVSNYGGIFSVFPIFFAWAGAFSEAIGGIFLLLGFQTRVASFLLMCTMLVAIFMQQIDNGLWNCLPAMGFLWVAMSTLILGSGRFGIDYLLIKMKNINIASFFIFILLVSSCVQKTKKQTVVFMLDAKDMNDIKKVGIRGEGKPLSWEKDINMIKVKDGVYTVTVISETPYLFSEFKFTINDDFELKDKENRRVYFNESRKTFYNAKFNVLK